MLDLRGCGCIVVEVRIRYTCGWVSRGRDTAYASRPYLRHWYGCSLLGALSVCDRNGASEKGIVVCVLDFRTDEPVLIKMLDSDPAMMTC